MAKKKEEKQGKEVDELEQKVKKATNKAKREVKKEAKKAAKKHPLLTTLVFLCIIILVGCCVLHHERIIHVAFLDNFISQKELDSSSSSNSTDSTDSSSSSDSSNSTDSSGSSDSIEATGGAFTPQDITFLSESDLSIHFLELGNKYTGDSTLIKVGNTEVLIDAGSRQNSATTITSYVNQFCTDGVLEYVIATHADQDHIAAFASSSKTKGIFESFACETIIDFPRTSKNTQVYNKYVEARDAEVAAGATHYTALQCYNETDGAKRSYTLGEGITMNFLYQKFYEEDTSDENDYSVCMLLTQTTTAGDLHYLFTGDLEEEGESSLVDNNTLPKCKLFKAGHHGSKTSSTDKLLSVIQPEIVCVCCCTGSDEYKAKPENTFPTQAFLDRVANYTTNVYATTLANDSETGYESMNGNIVVYSKNGEVDLRCSNNATVLKDTLWFLENRTCPEAWIN